MKIIVIALLFFSVSCTGQSSKTSSVHMSKTDNQENTDTLSVLDLNYDYRVFHLSFSDSSKDIIRLTQNGCLVVDILLPIADVDVKNFSVDQIKAFKKGFELSVNWGGGNNFYGRIFYFEFREDTIYLNKLQKKSYRLDSEKETLTDEKVLPPLRIDKIVLSEYIINE